MANSLPLPLRTAEISRFTLRATQLEKFKPAIAYWCNYYVVQLILDKGLHTESDDSMTYTTTLMDKLEKYKSENQDNDVIHDDMAAQAYVEQFAMETFQRGENTVQASKVTLQTAETFRAAAAFFDLLAIWQKPLNADVASKSKYAKYHALRIAKALKAGEDPNLSNPAPEAVTSPPPLDPNDPEVQRIRSLQPTVEDVSDPSHQPSFQRSISTRSPTIQSFSQPQTGGDVSPLESEQPGDGYFPRTPQFVSPGGAPLQPAAAADEIMTTPPSAQAPSLIEPRDFYNTNISQQPAQSPPFVPPKIPSQPPLAPQASVFQPSAPGPAAIATPARQVRENYIVDDEAILSAQKHAKWAISALNFEDVDTAVQELRIALQSLGAR